MTANLPARSVLLSVLLGSHPPALPVRTLVRTAELFGISEGSARVALSRLNADGEVVSDGGTYALSERHLDRQHAQDAALRPSTRAWDGQWVLGFAFPDQTPGGAEIRRVMERSRMGELRPGVWVRPDNLTHLDLAARTLMIWRGRPDEGADGAVEMAARLWDLDGWAGQAASFIRELAGAAEPADRLGVAAAMVRHIRTDPMLPPELLPAGWPGPDLRRAYDDYRAELGRLIAALRDD